MSWGEVVSGAELDGRGGGGGVLVVFSRFIVGCARLILGIWELFVQVNSKRMNQETI